jgi:hypothetical protein
MRLLLRAFPAGFRRRYGEELLELVSVGGSPARDGVNVVLAGLRMRIGGSALGIAFVSAAALGSAVLGGCVLLGSAAVASAGALVARRARPAVAR